jgi:hypothetical protein
MPPQEEQHGEDGPSSLAFPPGLPPRDTDTPRPEPDAEPVPERISPIDSDFAASSSTELLAMFPSTPTPAPAPAHKPAQTITLHDGCQGGHVLSVDHMPPDELQELVIDRESARFCLRT